jgi:hypothetical protein
MSDHTTLGRTTPDTNATTVGHLLDTMTGGLAGMMIGVMMIAVTTIGAMMTVVTMTAVTMIVVIEKSGDGVVTEFSGSLTGDTAQFKSASSAMGSKIDCPTLFLPVSYRFHLSNTENTTKCEFRLPMLSFGREKAPMIDILLDRRFSFVT